MRDARRLRLARVDVRHIGARRRVIDADATSGCQVRALLYERRRDAYDYEGPRLTLRRRHRAARTLRARGPARRTRRHRVDGDYRTDTLNDNLAARLAPRAGAHLRGAFAAGAGGE